MELGGARWDVSRVIRCNSVGLGGGIALPNCSVSPVFSHSDAHFCQKCSANTVFFEIFEFFICMMRIFEFVKKFSLNVACLAQIMSNYGI